MITAAPLWKTERYRFTFKNAAPPGILHSFSTKVLPEMRRTGTLDCFQTTRREKIEGGAPLGNGNGKRPRGVYNGNCRQQSVPLREDKMIISSPASCEKSRLRPYFQIHRGLLCDDD